MSESPDEQPQVERIRVRKRRSPASSTRRHLWWWLPLTAGLVAILVIGGGLFLRDVNVVRASLEETRTSLADVRGALGGVDVEAARGALDDADEALGVARSRSSGPLWTLASWVPIAGDSVEVVRDVVAVGTAALDVAQVAVTDGEELIAGGLQISVDDGQVDLAVLQDAAAVVDSLPIARLDAARARLEANEPRWAPEEILTGRAESLELADDAIDTAEVATALLDAVPGFLGVDEPRSYFLGVQTPGELRGTGGLIGYWVVLDVDDGRFSLAGGSVYDALDDVEANAQPADDEVEGDEAAGAVTSRIGELGGDPWDGVPTSREYRERYGHTAAPGFFSNVNVDPDLPTTARVALDLYTHRTDQELDGMILVDPIAMQLILEAIGQPIPVLGGADDDALPETLAPSEFARFTTVDVYEIYGVDSSPQRKELLRGLGDAAFFQVFDGAWDGVAVSRAISQAAGTRNLQVFSEDDGEQQAFGRVGVTGELTQPDGADLLAVTANNAVGGKQDVHVGHNITSSIDLGHFQVVDDDTVRSQRSNAVRVELDNPLPSEGMDTYIIGNCSLDEESGGCFEGPPGWNRTWFSVWTPGEDSLQATRVADGPAGVRAQSFHGLRVIDHYLETPPQSSEWFELDFDGPVTLERRGDTLVYRLLWHRQAKGIPDLLDLTVVPPDGWEAVHVTATGGGDGRGMGVNGAGSPLSAAATDDGGARLTGTVTADTTLEVHLERVAD